MSRHTLFQVSVWASRARTVSLFDLLVRNRWLPEELAASLNGMVGFRNIVVHGYEIVDPAVVGEITLHHLDNLLVFVAAIRGRLESV